jgi:ATP-binding cassette subfamily F protein 3
MALREVAIPQHISILYVQQEVIGDDTLAIESVLQADVHRTRLLAEEAELNAALQAMEDVAAQVEKGGDNAEAGETSAKRNRKSDDATARLGEVQKLLVEIDADTGPSRAAELLAGLGFSASDQVQRRGRTRCGRTDH